MTEDEHIDNLYTDIGKLDTDTPFNGGFTRKFLAFVNSLQRGLSALVISAVSPATGDKVLIQDVSDSDNLKVATVSSILALGGGSGVDQFTELTDAPASYSGQGGKFVKVNAGATGLEFAALAGGGDLLAANNLSDLANVVTARSNLGLSTKVQFYTALTDGNFLYEGDVGTIATQDADNVAITGGLIAVPSGNMRIRDTGTDNVLSLWVDEDLTADRKLNLKVSDGDRTLQLNGNTILSGTNTGDQTTIVGISGTQAQFNTACSDGNFMYGDNNLTDVSDATAARDNLGLGSMAIQNDDSVSIIGGSISVDSGLLRLKDIDGSHGLSILLTDDMAAERTLSLSVGGNDRSLTLAGNATISGTNTGDQNVPNASYRSLLDVSGSHIAARIAGTYWLGQGNPAGITGTGTLYAPNLIYIDSADYPAQGALGTKLRLRIQLYCNDVAPTGNYTFGLYPVTRPATSGGAGLCIYTLGTVVAGSTVAVTTPAADSSNILVGADFALPANGHYVIGFVSTANVANNAHVHISGLLQMRNA